MTRNEPTFHDLIRPPNDPLLLRRLSLRLRALAEASETPERRSEIEAALACPWWGLRELAIRAIGAWGGRMNRTWLTERARRPILSHRELWNYGRGAPERWQRLETIACRRAVGRLLDGEDTEWVLDLWFEAFREFSGLHDALGRLPLTAAQARIRREVENDDARHREAALWLVFNNSRFGMSEEVYRDIAAGPDAKLAKLARGLSAMEADKRANPEAWGIRTASAPPAARSRSSGSSAPR